MSSSIPIPTRQPLSPRPEEASPLGSSLPVRRLQLPASITSSSGPHASKDDLATIAHGWVPQPSIELVSRAARKWQSHHPLSLPPSPLPPTSKRRDGLPSGFPTNRAASPPPMLSASELRSPPPPPLPSPAPPSAGPHSPTNRPSRLRFDPWDFSEVVNASEEVRYAFETGSARATRPPRDGVSGTYFIRRNESHGDVLCVFKPVDEEAASIELSPNFTPVAAPSSAPLGGASALSLGPAHAPAPEQFPFAHSPPAPQHLSLQRSASSSSDDSESESRGARTTGFNPGEGAYKEVAAYLLDHDRFARVPQTVLARCHFNSELPEKKDVDGRSVKSIHSHGSVSDNGDFDFEDEDSDVDGEFDDDHDHEFGSNFASSSPDMSKRTKMGAFQVFIPNVGDADDYGTGVFDADQVHRIAVLDIRTLNHDRHGGNILVAKSTTPGRRYDLIPIDHGFILPEVIHGIPWPVWMDWPMAKQPLSEEVKSYIEYLDADKEAHILSEELDGVLRPGSLQALKIATALLQKGVAAGLTLYEIGQLMYINRENPMQMSELQKIVAEAIQVGETRHSHLGTDLDSAVKRRHGAGEDHHNLHRRHQSMSAINTHESYVDDFIVKYAVKRISEVVARVAEEKTRRGSYSSTDGVTFKPTKGAKLPRARSIPDFGIGVKPVHALLDRGTSNWGPTPAPTPASSPPYSRDASTAELGDFAPDGLTSTLGRPAVRQSPIDIPVKESSARRIGVPQPRLPLGGDDGLLGAGVEAERIGISGDLPPVFKRGSSERKPSPIAPMELVNWSGGSP